MAEPGGEIAAGAGRSQLRASHAEREQAIGLLKVAFVQGRLAKDEFDLRVGSALTSRTRTELAALTADIPAGLTGAQPPRLAQKAANKKPPAAVLGSIAVWWGTLIAISFWLGDNGPAGRSMGAVIVAVLLQISIVSVWLIAYGLRRATGQRLSRDGGQESQGPVLAHLANGFANNGSGQPRMKPDRVAVR